MPSRNERKKFHWCLFSTKIFMKKTSIKIVLACVFLNFVARSAIISVKDYRKRKISFDYRSNIYTTPSTIHFYSHFFFFLTNGNFHSRFFSFCDKRLETVNSRSRLSELRKMHSNHNVIFHVVKFFHEV